MSSYNAVHNTAVKIFTDQSCMRTDEKPYTHLLLTGGAFSIHGEKFEELYAKLGSYLKNKGVEMPSVSECRSSIFPMYYDLDLKLPIATMGVDAVQSIVRVIIKQTTRFYPEDIRERLGRCIVTTKTGLAEEDPETGLFKHGVHVHFPRILVNENNARQIRMGVLNGLISYLGSWVEILGIDPGDKWDDFVDDAVYNNGLRMIGAPKASKCKQCKMTDITCDACEKQNKNFIIDRRVYMLCMVLSIDGERDADFEVELSKNMTLLLSNCTVRKDDGTLPTEGYAIYPGCPQLTSTYLTAASKGKKRKGNMSVLSGAGKRPMDRRFTDEITDAKVRDIVRKYLLSYASVYATCTFDVYRGGDWIRVKLKGDDAKFCINKQGYHNSNNVYMDFRRRGVNAHVYMKCYCPCKTSVGRNGYHTNCSMMGDRTKKDIDQCEVDVLFAKNSSSTDPFAKVVDCMFGNASARMMTDKEILEGVGVDC
tara:strand:+ start:2633 stop:4072 length:1440 start_codon:yes stop_codon:yes gene_type:complete